MRVMDDNPPTRQSCKADDPQLQPISEVDACPARGWTCPGSTGETNVGDQAKANEGKAKQIHARLGCPWPVRSDLLSGHDQNLNAISETCGRGSELSDGSTELSRPRAEVGCGLWNAGSGYSFVHPSSEGC